MALTLTKEDGTGKADANTYASVADGDAYHDGHLYASAWTVAATANKEAALVFATRLIDVEYQFNGFKANEGQALQWPRVSCPDPDGAALLWPVLPWRTGRGGALVSGDVVPKAVAEATCEMARELLIEDRTAAPPGEGLTETQGADYSKTIYSKKDTRPIISHVAQAMLAKFGALVRGGSGAVRLMRV
ncbi:MAG: DnaT-like ssDNA-binding protein [Limisphaerales bacterium]